MTDNSLAEPNFVFDDSSSSRIGKAWLLRRGAIEHPRQRYSTTACHQAPAAAMMRRHVVASYRPWWTRRQEVVKYSLTRCLMTLAKGLCLGWHPAEAVEHHRQTVFSGSVPSSIPSGGCGDTMSSDMAWGGYSMAGSSHMPLAARDDDGVPSSTALAVFSARASSRMGWRRLCLPGVVKHRRDTCLTTQCGRARFFVAYYALSFSPAPLAPNGQR